MRISNKNVDLAISKLEEFEDEGFDLRTDLTRPDWLAYRNKKYFLYQTTASGYQCPGTYGMLVAGFKTQKEFIEYVNLLTKDKDFINEKEKAEEKIETTKEEILTEEVEFNEEMEI